MSTSTSPRLNNKLLASGHKFPAELRHAPRKVLPERVLQFGEGGFLRGFVDWMFGRLNAAGQFNGSIVVVQPLASGMIPQLNEQDGLYTLALRGVSNGKVVEDLELVTPVSRGLNPYSQYADYLACARNADLRYIVSNTTEAGIACDVSDKPTDTPPKSFPAKLVLLLLERHKTFKGAADKGFVMLPCELIERNGDNLRRCVLETAKNWKMDAAFVAWVEKHNVFCNTLVDRIVTGYPREEVAAFEKRLGYNDQLLNTGEYFHAWVIEGPASLANELPFAKIGLNVTLTDNINPYRDRKVRILNGAHTSTVLAAYLSGKDTVKECMDDPVISKYLAKILADEIIPTLDLPKADLTAFAAAVSERFANPFIKHMLLSISLNSTSKYTARVLPSLKEYLKRKNTLPSRLVFSLAALIAFYRGTEIRGDALIGKRTLANGATNEYQIKDSASVLEVFSKAWKACDGTPASLEKLTAHILAETAFWHEDLTKVPGLTKAVAAHLGAILANPVAAISNVA